MSQWSCLYNNRRWRKLRAAQLDREPLCRMCRDRGRATVATVCDHVIPHKGDLHLFWTGPFQSLCKTCHDSAKAIEEGRGVVVGCTADGRPLDPQSHWHG